MVSTRHIPKENNPFEVFRVAVQRLRAKNPLWKNSAEIVVIGFLVMMVSQMFSGGTGQSPAVPPQATYTPPPPAPQVASAAPQQVPQPTPAPSQTPVVTQQQLQQIKKAAGGGNVKSALPVEPKRMKPARPLEEVAPDSSDKDFGTYKYKNK